MSANNLIGLFCDDISFCPVRCDRLDCMRNQQNIRDRTIPHSYFMEIPDDCPKENFGNLPVTSAKPTWQQGKAYCGACGKRIPLKIKARFCHKCGKEIDWQ